jgi:hypothetical protein
MEPTPAQRVPGRALIARRDIEKRAYTLRLENESARVFVGLDQIVESGLGQHLFQTQSVFEPFSNIDQRQFLIAEVLRSTLHIFAVAYPGLSPREP